VDRPLHWHYKDNLSTDNSFTAVKLQPYRNLKHAVIQMSCYFI